MLLQSIIFQLNELVAPWNKKKRTAAITLLMKTQRSFLKI